MIEERLKQREAELAEREIDLLQRELNVMILQVNFVKNPLFQEILIIPPKCAFPQILVQNNFHKNDPI